MGMELEIKVYVITHETESGVDVHLCKNIGEVEKLKFELLDDRPENERVEWSVQTLKWSM